MEPLNLMVSLSHFAKPHPGNKNGLSPRAGRKRRLIFFRQRASRAAAYQGARRQLDPAG
jgi:hypothetical protein